MALSVNGKAAAALIQGTGHLSPMAEADAAALLDAVVGAGARTFDLAENYGRGAAESRFGAWLAKVGGRNELFVLTKGGHPYDGRNRITLADLTDDLHGSLDRLRCDSVDLYLLHRDDEQVPVAEVVEILAGFRSQGLIGAYGVSNWRAQRIEAANAYARERGLEPLAASSNHFSLAVPSAPPWPGCVSVSGPDARNEREFYVRSGLPLLAWSSLAMGYFAAGGPGAPDLPEAAAVFDTPTNAARRTRAQQLARKHGLTPTQLALAYTLSQPMNVHAVVGCRSAGEFVELSAAAALRLTEEEVVTLEGA